MNRHLVSEVDGLEPGTALDLGCADGADAIWLAAHGWEVTAVDVAAPALDRARDHAVRRGLADRIRWTRCDLAADFPSGAFDLVSAQFLHSPVALPGERERILRRSARAVAPGGHLLVVSHWRVPPWHPPMPDPGHPVNLTLQSPAENRAALRLADGDWEVVRDALVGVYLVGPDGRRGRREDHVLHVRRLEG
ncbi:class I SAM-dependent methyltransferase [Brachybacterium huguangmaarense]|uniref:Class I SAM-dependent methyltransferase n=1 Tax=Brachybacterium huguangmaarense TaxID=1652028 RepID=A0ABY6G0C2_9MICO|nr:class I SAM-dependent methyltransferase [Brachybacterium huguangmaarense]UYG16587.1 class I SAM-dependent methyltransferase [Brachybacterium huguangmaarense]